MLNLVKDSNTKKLEDKLLDFIYLLVLRLV